MSVFYVFQGETYAEESTGGYVWSPKLTRNGRQNAGYTMMTKIRKGDFILHNNNTKLVAVSIAQTDCYDSNQPHEISAANTTIDWDQEGYRVDTEYHEFNVPLKVTDYKEWLKDHFSENSAFTREGLGKTQYMCRIADQQAIFLLEKAIKNQNDKDVIELLGDALNEIIDDKESEYDKTEMEIINELVEDDSDDTIPEWEGKKEKQAVTTSNNTNREVPKRDPKRAADALVHAGHVCEFNSEDRTFLRKNGNPYTEPHHLIPICKYKDFEYSVDVMENIVSLCSHCHNLLHYGRFDDKKPILEKLYNERKDALRECGLDLTLEQLESYYR